MNDSLPDTHSNVLFEMAGHVATITINRPDKGNAFDESVKLKLVDAWLRVKNDTDIRVAIITGAGERHFCTGVDLGMVASQEHRAVGEPLREAVRLTGRQNGVGKPVICAVNGLAVGGGLHFVADADIVVASDTAAFIDTHVNVGLVSALESIALTRRLPIGTVLRMALSGRDFRLAAGRAYELGLVDELVPEGTSLAKAMEIAETIAKNSPSALALTQRAIWQSLDMPLGHALESGWSLVQLQWTHPDYVEGPKAFAEGREPIWEK